MDKANWQDHVNACLSFVRQARDRFGAERLPELMAVPVRGGAKVVVKTANILTMLKNEEAKLASGRLAYGADRPLNRAQKRALKVN